MTFCSVIQREKMIKILMIWGQRSVSAWSRRYSLHTSSSSTMRCVRNCNWWETDSLMCYQYHDSEVLDLLCSADKHKTQEPKKWGGIISSQPFGLVTRINTSPLCESLLCCVFVDIVHGQIIRSCGCKLFVRSVKLCSCENIKFQ